MGCTHHILLVIVLINGTYSINTTTLLKECTIDVINILSTSLSSKCTPQLYEYLENLRQDKSSWAFQMLDATSKLQSGIMSLNFGELGNFDQCIRIQTNKSETGTILGKYCLGSIPIVAEKPNVNDNKTLQMYFTSKSLGDLGASPSSMAGGPTWAICVPNGCYSQDVALVVKTIFVECLEIEANIEFNDLYCQTIDDVNSKLETGAIIALVFLSLLFAVVIICSLYDIYSIIQKKDCAYTLIKGFSVYSNGQNLFKIQKPTPNQLSCLNGLKFLSMMWIIIGHQYSVIARGSLVNNIDLINWANSWYSMFIVNGGYAVDTFLVAGGVLVSYNFMKARYKSIPFNIYQYYLHRYLRLTAGLGLIVLVSATMLKYMGSGPNWPSVNLYFQKNCEKYWWTSLLYVQNYVNVEKMCVGQAWYLAVDMQLYFLSPAICFLLYKCPTCTLGLLAVTIFSANLFSFFASWNNNLTAILTNFYGNHTDYSNKYYLLTHTRAAPWIIGVILGYFIFKIKIKAIEIKLQKVFVVIFWCVCLATLLVCVLGGFQTLRSEEYDKWGNAFHIAFARQAWAVAIAWIIFACLTNNGGPINWILSLDIYQVFLQFTYSIYLIHVTMLYLIVFSKKTPEYFSEFSMAYYFWATFWFSTLFSVIVVFTAELPMVTIDKLIFSQIPWKIKIENPDDGVINIGYEK